MAGNDYGNTPPNPGADPAAEETGDPMGQKSVSCLHVYVMEDGSFRVTQAAGEEVPQDAEAMASPEEVMAKVEEVLSAPPPDDNAMIAAKAGYAKAANRAPMAAPNPGAVFGE